MSDYIKNLFMEDVHSAALRGSDEIVNDLQTIGICFSEKQIDDIYIAIDTVLENMSNGSYRKDT